MKKITLIVLMALICVQMGMFSLFALEDKEAEAKERSFGIGLHLLGGGRYDNVRMCVGSPAGVPGGPIAEFYLDLRFPLSEDGTFVVNIPLFRPIFFELSFQMLQFEPQVTYEHVLGKGDGVRPVVAAGLGTVLHYGPDYNSSPEARGDPFFSFGPLVSGSAGLTFFGGRFVPGVKVFYAPLFSPGRPVGTIIGGGLEIQVLLGG